MMNKHYILDKDHNILEVDLMIWADYMKNPDRIVKQEKIDDMFISTVFLGLDHSWSEQGPPIIFETMMKDTTVEGFGGWEDYQERCSTWEEALKMHEDAVKYYLKHRSWKLKLKALTQKIFNRSSTKDSSQVSS